MSDAPRADLARRLVAEGLGTGLLVAAIVGSGLMAQALTRDVGLQLLVNAVPTGALLVVLISVLGPISGAHFNPVVSLAMAQRGDLSKAEIGPYLAAQTGGALCGALVAHAMFAAPLISLSVHPRAGAAQMFSEAVATFGLLLTIIGGLRLRPSAVPHLVGLYIVAAYWFTASTSFANPAVTLARMFTDSFSGIRPGDAPAFIAAQLAGGAAGAALSAWLFRPQDGASKSLS